MQDEKTLYLEEGAPHDRFVATLKALASRPRLDVLRLLADAELSVAEIAAKLNVPPSTAAVHVRVLEEAALLRTVLRPASHGLQKICSRTYDRLLVDLPASVEARTRRVEVSMPIGAYTDFDIGPPCGLAGETALIGYIDDPLSFYEPDRVRAGLLWFGRGYLEYSFPNRLPEGASPAKVTVAIEACSEAPRHDDRWPSDITLWINGCDVGTWTCGGDYGGQRGRLTPRWWNTDESQFGRLKRWTVTPDGAFLDGHPLSPTTLADLGLDREPLTTVRIGIKPGTAHVGGVNLFGRSFGNYPQDISMELAYAPARPPGATPDAAG